jgi:hypothetical protein
MTKHGQRLRSKRNVVRLLSMIAFAALTIVGTQQFAHAQAITVVASTVPSNGDVNPYGIVRIPKTIGALVAGNILVSNFNNSANLQGTGTTIVQIGPTGTVSLFAAIDASTLPGACPGGVGLTTALAVLRSGWVIVGSLPTSDGTSATAQSGCLIVLDSNGKVAETFSDSLINGPWDMTALDSGRSAVLFVTNVLNGTVAGGGKVVRGGTVIRLNLSIPNGSMPALQAITTIASGYVQRTDPGALVIGPTGLALSKDSSTLYVADSLVNQIRAVSNPLSRVSTANIGTLFSSGGSLKDPLGLALAPNGDILAVNGTNGYLTEITPAGQQISKTLLDNSGTPPGTGALFGLVDVKGQGIYYVDDATNTLNLLQ